jgi:hypothetical protein
MDLDWLDVLLTVLPPLFGAAVWRRHGASWVEVLSWTVPVALLLGIGFLLADPPLSAMLVLLGAALFAAMMLSARADRWWHRIVLRERQ